jgi:hypothetical protein
VPDSIEEDAEEPAIIDGMCLTQRILPREMIEAVLGGEIHGLGAQHLYGCIFRRTTTGARGYLLAQCTGVVPHKRRGAGDAARAPRTLKHGWTSRSCQDTTTEVDCISNSPATHVEILHLASAIRKGELTLGEHVYQLRARCHEALQQAKGRRMAP